MTATVQTNKELTFAQASKNQAKRVLKEIRNQGGLVHSSIRESFVDYARMAGMRDTTIIKQLLETGMPYEDAIGATRG